MTVGQRQGEMVVVEKESPGEKVVVNGQLGVTLAARFW